ncbi:DUF106 domain-containing protein [Halomicrobium sp. HM KBTZ05]|uniref:DUF106 domain-containing protein n=1 Tax=Halomicrobium sp. HM KBTZ05 TaxID=3242663 RepID=UPI003558AECB
MDSSLDAVRADDDLAVALAVVLDRAEAGDGTVAWADLRGQIDPVEWGRLLDHGVVVPAGDRFVVDDPTAARELLAQRDLDDADPDAPETGGWSRADKLAGVGALALMASYQLPGGRELVGQSVNTVLGPLAAQLPFVATITLLAVVTALASTTIRRRLQSKERMERLKTRLTDVRERLDDARERGDDEAVERLRAEQQELMTQQLSMFKHMLRPMAWTVLVSAPIFLWLSWLAVAPAAAIAPTATVFPMLGRITWTAKLIGPLHVWTVWYIATSMLSGLTIQRTMDRVDTAA